MGSRGSCGSVGNHETWKFQPIGGTKNPRPSADGRRGIEPVATHDGDLGRSRQDGGANGGGRVRRQGECPVRAGTQRRAVDGGHRSTLRERLSPEDQQTRTVGDQRCPGDATGYRKRGALPHPSRIRVEDPGPRGAATVDHPACDHHAPGSNADGRSVGETRQIDAVPGLRFRHSGPGNQDRLDRGLAGKMASDHHHEVVAISGSRAEVDERPRSSSSPEGKRCGPRFRSGIKEHASAVEDQKDPSARQGAGSRSLQGGGRGEGWRGRAAAMGIPRLADLRVGEEPPSIGKPSGPAPDHQNRVLTNGDDDGLGPWLKQGGADRQPAPTRIADLHRRGRRQSIREAADEDGRPALDHGARRGHRDPRGGSGMPGRGQNRGGRLAVLKSPTGQDGQTGDRGEDVTTRAVHHALYRTEDPHT